ncbi:MAG: hypothetical protein NDJ72_00080 [Elusimicrobia bacterium]|nr:hypothetical protein [Elusimicrobiota bacterium]
MKALRDHTDKALAVYQKDLVKRSQWGEITFEKAEADLVRAQELLTYLKELPLDVLPDGVINSTNTAVQQLIPILTRIDTFTLNTGNPAAQRDDIATQFHGQVDSVYNTVGVWIPFLAYKKGDIAENVGRLSQAVAEAKATLEEAKQTTEAKKIEIDSIVAAARAASASAGAAVFTEDFLKESSTQEKLAKNWLIAAGVIGVLGIVAASAMWLVAYKSQTLETSQLVQVIAAKLVILSILIGAASWCGGIYKALRHQTSMNKHRALSLRTLQAFVKAGSDDQTKNAVLMEACRAVFLGGNTGYLDGKGGGMDESSLKVIEIAKTLSGKS